MHLTGDTTIYARWTQADLQSEDTILTYDPDAPITKQEAAKTLYQMARQLGLDTEEGQGVDLGQFEDADEISEDAADAVRWAYAVDLLTEKNGSLHITDELSQKELTACWRTSLIFCHNLSAPFSASGAYRAASEAGR